MDGWIGVITGISLGVLFIIIGWPLTQGKIGPNSWYGYRSTTSRSSEAIWYPVNRMSGRHLMTIGTGCIVLGVLAVIWANEPGAQKHLVLIILGWVTIGIVISIYLCQQLVNSLKNKQ